jgi:SAM-dependent methyltransferase
MFRTSNGVAAPLPVNSSIPRPEFQNELQRIYSFRFSGLETYRNNVWRELVQYFSMWIQPSDSVLDLGCGYCEFINNVSAREKFAMDLNPTAKTRIAAGTRFLEQDCSLPWPLASDSLDVIFSSNFFEHLPSKAALQATLLEAYRCLKPGGRLIAMGPNVKLLSGEYWDFFDHHLPLTELALSEAMLMAGYEVEGALARFLPYTMSLGFRPPLWTLRLYLKLPVVWKIFGRQFLVIGKKAVPAAS